MQSSPSVNYLSTWKVFQSLLTAATATVCVTAAADDVDVCELELKVVLSAAAVAANQPNPRTSADLTPKYSDLEAIAIATSIYITFALSNYQCACKMLETKFE